MKKSDELFRQALAAKADEIEQAKRRIAKMAQHTTTNKEALVRAQSQAIEAVNARRSEHVNDTQRQIDKINTDSDEHVRQLNAMYATLLEQEDQRLADYEQFENEIVNGFNGKKRNSSEVIPLEKAAE